jgi:hypothetical protein
MSLLSFANSAISVFLTRANTQKHEPMSAPSTPLTLRCRPSLKVIFLSGLFFAACAGIIGWKAHTNDQGLALNGLVEFSPASASAFYWVIAALSAAFVVAALLILAVTLTNGVPDIVVTDHPASDRGQGAQPLRDQRPAASPAAYGHEEALHRVELAGIEGRRQGP